MTMLAMVSQREGSTQMLPPLLRTQWDLSPNYSFLAFSSLFFFLLSPLHTGAMVLISMTSILLDLGFLHVYHFYYWVSLVCSEAWRAYSGPTEAFILFIEL